MINEEPIPTSNRFNFLLKVAFGLHKLGCDLATYKSDATRSHYRSMEVNPLEYAILGPIIDTRKNILGIKIGPRPASKVLCNVLTEYTYDVSMSIKKFRFNVFNPDNVDLVAKIIREIYQPTQGFGFSEYLINVVQLGDKYENFH